MALPKLTLAAAPRPAAYLAAVVAIAAGGWVAWQGWEDHQRYVPIAAEVLEARVDTLVIVGKPKYGADIRYRFEQGGIVQTNNVVVRGNPSMSAREAAKWVRIYRPGTLTSAWVNATDANDIVLVRPTAFRLPGLVGLLGVLALVFLLWEDRGAIGRALRARAGTGKKKGSTEWLDPRGRPPTLDLTPPPGMEGARWDPTPGPDGLPIGWVKDEPKGRR
jgi:hypothetical protein